MVFERGVEMKKRIEMFLSWVGKCLILSVGGMITIAASVGFSLDNMQKMVHLTHGLIGFGFGLAFIIGGVISGIIFWIITGRNLFTELIN